LCIWLRMSGRKEGGSLQLATLWHNVILITASPGSSKLQFLNGRMEVTVSNCFTGDQGSFPAEMPGNSVPKVILTVGTAFPGKPLVIRYIFVNELQLRNNSQCAVICIISVKARLIHKQLSRPNNGSKRSFTGIGLQTANVWQFDLQVCLIWHLNQL